MVHLLLCPRLVGCFSNAETVNGFRTRLDKINAKLERWFSALDDSQLESNDLDLPGPFKNLEIVQHVGELKINARAVITSASSIADENSFEEVGVGIPYASEYREPFDNSRTAEIRQWIDRVSICSKSSKQKESSLNSSDLDGGESNGTDTSESTIRKDDRQLSRSDFSNAEEEMKYNVTLEYFSEVHRLDSYDASEKVLRLYKGCIDNVERLNPKYKRRLSFNLVKVSFAYHFLNHDDLIDSAITIFQELMSNANGDNTHNDLCAVYAHHGLAFLNLRLFFCNEAETWCRKAIAGWQNLSGEGDRRYTDSLKLMALIHEIKGESIEARAVIKLVPHSGSETKDINHDQDLIGLTEVPTKAFITSIHKKRLAKALSAVGSWRKFLLRLCSNPDRISWVVNSIDGRDKMSGGNLRLLLNHFLSKGWSIHEKDRYGDGPLHIMAQIGHAFAAEFLLEKGAPVDEVGYWGKTALHCAIEGNHDTVIRLLLDKGASLDEVDHQGKTALHYAIERNHETTVQLLLDKGASADVRDKCRCFRTLDGTLKLSIDEETTIAKPDFGFTPVHYAIIFDNNTIVKNLLDHGVSIHTSYLYDSDFTIFLGSDNLYSFAKQIEASPSIVSLLKEALERAQSVSAQQNDGTLNKSKQ